MLKLAGRRILLTIPTMLGVMLVALLLVELMPGDPAAVMAGDNATPEAIAAIRRDLNLDRPLPLRYFDYVTNAITGDLGHSPGSSVTVWSRISAALPITISLAIVAMIFSAVIGVFTGVAAALRQGKLVDRLVTTGSSVLLAVPSFVIGLVLVIVFAVKNSFLPATGYDSIKEGLWPWLEHLILPGISLALVSSAEIARQTRGAMVDTMEQDYIRAARAKGLERKWIIWKHAAKNAATPVVTVTGLQVARILGGAIVVERIFGLSGFGTLAVNAVLTRDVVLIQGVVLISALAVLATNLVVDLSYGYFNPQARAS